MVEIIDASRRNLLANLVPQLTDIGQQIGSQLREGRSQALAEQALGGDIESVSAELLTINPQLFSNVKTILDGNNRQQALLAQESLEETAVEATSLLSIKNPAARNQRLGQMVSAAKAEGASDEEMSEIIELINMPLELQDAELKKDILASKRAKDLFSAAGFGAEQVKGRVGAGVIVEIGGRQFFSNPVTDPVTSQSVTALTPVDGGPPINVDPNQLDQAISSGQATLSETQPSGAPAEIVSREGLTAKQRVEQKRLESEATASGKGGAERRQSQIDSGLSAADSLPVLKRAITLLGKVKTGGIQSTAGLSIRKFFGVEGADEGELSANLGKAVLSQLRSTFGAAFTEKEGARLESIEARFGNNPETNRRLLEQAMQVADRSARRGIAAAREEGDKFSIGEIEDALKFEFKFDEEEELVSPGGSAAERLRALEQELGIQ